MIEALNLLLDADVSALPVVNGDNILIDIYTRTDITHLAKNHAYTRLQQEELTVHQALSLGRETPSIPEHISSSGGIVGGLTASFMNVAAGRGESSSLWTSPSVLLHSVTRSDTLKTVVERLARPNIQRLMVIDAPSHALEGIISLTDIANYLFMPHSHSIPSEATHERRHPSAVQ